MINNVSEGLSKYVTEDLTYATRGEVLEDVLTEVCERLGEAGVITENKADLEMVLGVVGAYLIAKNKDTLPEDSKPPSYIFDNSLFPMLDNEIAEEEIINEEEQ